MSSPRDGGRLYFAQNLRISPFKKDLLKDTRFSQVYVAGQNLQAIINCIFINIQNDIELWKTNSNLGMTYVSIFA